MFVRCFAKYVLINSARPRFLSVAISCLLFLPGCGGPDFPQTEPVSGTVSLNGKPIEGVEVYFVSEELVTSGKTDSQGHYDLVNGALAGENKVYFSKIDGESQFEEGDGMDDLQMAEAAASGVGARKAKAAKQVIPAEYSNANEPKLDFEVPSGGSESADFKL